MGHRPTDEELDRCIHRQAGWAPPDTKGGRNRQRQMALTPYSSNCNDKPLVLSSEDWKAVYDLSKLNGHGWGQENYLSGPTGRQLANALADGRYTFTDARLQKVLGDVVALLRQGRGLRLKQRYADEPHISVGQ